MERDAAFYPFVSDLNFAARNIGGDRHQKGWCDFLSLSLVSRSMQWTLLGGVTDYGDLTVSKRSVLRMAYPGALTIYP